MQRNYARKDSRQKKSLRTGTSTEREPEGNHTGNHFKQHLWDLAGWDRLRKKKGDGQADKMLQNFGAIRKHIEGVGAFGKGNLGCQRLV